MTTHHFTRTALGAALIASFSHAALRGLWLASEPAHKCPSYGGHSSYGGGISGGIQW
ncbi:MULTISPECIES: hypothetical protein [Halomonas]|uniref:hypothetical protein n=1 Tax=Halomonas TaxID=2745 RepID=UPI001557EB69|nr:MULTISPECIES: hypothetical protein [Halomonas]